MQFLGHRSAIDRFGTHMVKFLGNAHFGAFPLQLPCIRCVLSLWCFICSEPV